MSKVKEVEIGKTKKAPAHLHTGTPAPHFFNKMTRATCAWASKLEVAIIERNSEHTKAERNA